MSDDAFNAAGADGPGRLPEFLSNDLGGRFGIEEAMANDLSFDLISPDRVGLGSAFLVLKAEGSLFLESFLQLIISLS